MSKDEIKRRSANLPSNRTMELIQISIQVQSCKVHEQRRAVDETFDG